jgi:hypothetical protein
MVMIRHHARGWLERVLPMLPMSRDLIFRQKIPLRLPVLKALLHINLSMHFLYVGSRCPRYAGVGRFLQRHLLWRMESRPAKGES